MEHRVLTFNEAAEYCRLSTHAFRSWMKKGHVPGPLPGTRRWDRRALDRALDRLSGLDEEPIEKPAPRSAFDAWKADQQ